jgi:hypothetical protein
MKTFCVTITGIAPLLQHRFDDAAALEEGTRAVHVQKEDPRTIAERNAHRTTEGSLFLPGAAIARLLREAGGAHKQRGSRKSLKYIIPAAVLVLEDEIVLRDPHGTPLTEFEVDTRSVVIPSTKGRVLRHRPRLNSWGAEFSLEIDETVLDPTTVHQLLTEGGTRVGLGDYRPEKGGPFGRFQVVAWAEMTARPPLKVAA